jgi:hypothetical protein
MVTQGYRLADLDGLTLRQLFYFTRLATERIEQQARALKAAAHRR